MFIERATSKSTLRSGGAKHEWFHDHYWKRFAPLERQLSGATIIYKPLAPLERSELRVALEG
jgi:hypothetical protein